MAKHLCKVEVAKAVQARTKRTQRWAVVCVRSWMRKIVTYVAGHQFAQLFCIGETDRGRRTTRVSGHKRNRM